MARRCASGILRSAVTSATLSTLGSGVSSGGPWRSIAATPFFALRQRLAASRHATVRTQASGSSYVATVDQRCHARAYASCTSSCASARLPVIAYIWCMTRRPEPW
jgi:hypothetical protein